MYRLRRPAPEAKGWARLIFLHIPPLQPLLTASFLPTSLSSPCPKFKFWDKKSIPKTVPLASAQQGASPARRSPENARALAGGGVYTYCPFPVHHQIMILQGRTVLFPSSPTAIRKLVVVSSFHFRVDSFIVSSIRVDLRRLGQKDRPP